MGTGEEEVGGGVGTRVVEVEVEVVVGAEAAVGWPTGAARALQPLPLLLLLPLMPTRRRRRGRKGMMGAFFSSMAAAQLSLCLCLCVSFLRVIFADRYNTICVNLSEEERKERHEIVWVSRPI